MENQITVNTTGLSMNNYFFLRETIEKMGLAEKKRLNYYKHGPLARVELGNEKCTDLDYAYTLNRAGYKGR